MSHFQRRVERCKALMEEQGVDALLLFKPQNTFYLSGFNAIIYSRPVVIAMHREGDPCLVVPRLRFGHAQEEADVKDIRMYHKIRITEAAHSIPSDPIAVARDFLGGSRKLRGKLGIEFDSLPVDMHKKLQEQFPAVEFVDVTNLFAQLRVVKDEHEISMTRIAAEISDVGMKAAVDTVQVGATGVDVSVEAMRAMNEHWRDRYPTLEVADFGGLEGGIANSLWCYCLYGKEASYGCDSPTPIPLRRGDTPYIVIFVTVNGYHVENERMPVIGKPSQEQQEAFHAFFEASQQAIDTIKPGVGCAEVARAAARVYEARGFAEYSHARAGHSLGLGAHENPSFALNEEMVLAPNMVFSVEPSIKIRDDLTVATSSTGIVTENGFEVLTLFAHHEFLTVQERK